MFVTLLMLAKPGRLARITIAASGIAAISFILAALISVGMTFALHPQAPDVIQGGASDSDRIQLAVAFGFGIYALLFAIGIGGFIRSRSLGIVTALAAAIAMLIPLLG